MCISIRTLPERRPVWNTHADLLIENLQSQTHVLEPERNEQFAEGVHRATCRWT